MSGENKSPESDCGFGVNDKVRIVTTLEIYKNRPTEKKSIYLVRLDVWKIVANCIQGGKV